MPPLPNQPSPVPYLDVHRSPVVGMGLAACPAGLRSGDAGRSASSPEGPDVRHTWDDARGGQPYEESPGGVVLCGPSANIALTSTLSSALWPLRHCLLGPA